MGRYSSNTEYKTANSAFNLGGKLVPCKVKQIILNPNTTLANDFGGHEAVGLIFYNRVRKKFSGAGVGNVDGKDKIEVDSYDGVAKPLFPFIKYYPLINEIVTVISLTSKDYLEDRNAIFDYYLPPINLWNHPHHNTLPAVANYTTLQEEVYRSEDYEHAGLVRRPVDGNLDLNIPLGKYFKEHLNIKPLLPYEGDHITEGRFGNSIRLGATARGVDKDEEKGIEGYEFPTASISPWSKGGASENGDPIIIIRNGQPKELDNLGWKHTIEDINLDPSSIYLTSTQNVENFQVAADMCWYSFGLNVEMKEEDNKVATDVLNDPTGTVTAKEQGSSEVESEDKTPPSTETTSNTTESEITGSAVTGSEEIITEDQAGFNDDIDEDTNEYYQQDFEGQEKEIIDRPPLPDNYRIAAGGFDEWENCSNCNFHRDNQCSKWGAKVRAKHENPWVCNSWVKVDASTSSNYKLLNAVYEHSDLGIYGSYERRIGSSNSNGIYLFKANSNGDIPSYPNPDINKRYTYSGGWVKVPGFGATVSDYSSAAQQVLKQLNDKDPGKWSLL